MKEPKTEAPADEALRLPPPPAPLFVARQAYRRRRMADAARFLPIVGVVLFLLPILWEPARSPEPDTERGAVWLFTAWFILIVAAFGLAIPLARADRDSKPGQR
ncbi:MAG: hypothetical protein RLZZ528_2800 [Pseudomonadota bacterium]|jgi:hypothetical protein